MRPKWIRMAEKEKIQIHFTDLFWKVCVLRFFRRLTVVFVACVDHKYGWPAAQQRSKAQKLGRLAFYFRFSSLLPANDYLSSVSDTFCVDICARWACELVCVCVKWQCTLCAVRLCGCGCCCASAIVLFAWCFWLISFIRSFVMCWHCRLHGILTMKWCTGKERDRERK